jgi:MFS family permease
MKTRDAEKVGVSVSSDRAGAMQLDRRTRRFATAAMVGVVVYVLVVAVLQLLPPHYDPIREAESNLAVGPFGWIMNLNFLGRTATTAFALLAISRVGTATRLRTLGLVAFAIGGASSAVLAFFATDVDVVGGAGATTSAGLVHLIVAAAGFAAALAGILLLTAWMRPQRDLDRTYGVALAFAVVAVGGALWLLLSATVAPGLLGLAERVCLAGVLGWTFFVCAGIRRASTRSDNHAA